MKHYVYRITNIKLNKHYYGTRTSKNKTPEQDIGIYYFSSSKDKEFIKDQKENPQDYKYKIIKKFNTRKEAIELEIELHNKFNVGINESFYNRSKQSSVGFDTTGLKITMPKRSKEHQDKLNKSYKGRAPWNKGKTGLQESWSKGKTGVFSEETLEKMRSWKPTLETKEKMSKNHADFTGEKSPSARNILIFDENKNLKFECFGNFKKVCEYNNLPYPMFLKCLCNNKKAYETQQAKTRARKNGNEKYIGWSIVYK